MVFPTIIGPLCRQNKTKLDICAYDLRWKFGARDRWVGVSHHGTKSLPARAGYNNRNGAPEPAAARDRVIGISVTRDRINVGESLENVRNEKIQGVGLGSDGFLPTINRQWLSKYRP